MGWLSKGLAVGGGVVGGIVTGGNPAGIMAGAGLGGALGGALEPNDHPPTYADINLKKENPELWKELQRLRAINKEYESLYARRAQGPNSAELIAKEDALARGRDVQNSKGTLGSSAGVQMQADLENRVMASIQERAAAEQERLLNGQRQSEAQYMEALSGAQQGALGVRNARYMADQAESEAQNQFYSSLANSGMQLYASGKLGDVYKNTPKGAADIGGDVYQKYGDGSILPGTPVAQNDPGRYMAGGYYPGGYENPFYRRGVG